MSFKCPICARVSHHPKDEEHQYCGACNIYFEGAEPAFPSTLPHHWTLKNFYLCKCASCQHSVRFHPSHAMVLARENLCVGSCSHCNQFLVFRIANDNNKGLSEIL